MRTARRITILLLALFAAALLLVACGDDGDGESESAGSAAVTIDDSADDEPAEQATATLDVRLEKVGDKDQVGPPVPSTMRCTRSIPASCDATIECPVDEDADERASTTVEVCQWLGTEGITILTEEVPERQACTMIYGGAATATVTGTVDGEQVDAEFSRQDGCAIARWDAVQALWTQQFDPPPAGRDATVPPTDPDEPVSSTVPEPDVIDDPPEAFQ